MAQQAPPDPRTCTILYKILTPSEKEALPQNQWKGTEFDVSIHTLFAPLQISNKITESFLLLLSLFLQQKDGFIHLSTSHQTSGTLERFFSESSNVGNTLYLFALPRTNIFDAQNRLKFEPAAGTEFGHIYGTLDPSKDFAEEYRLERGSDGLFTLPELPF
jgi:uncharacterized protein (DUF952 family)